MKKISLIITSLIILVLMILTLQKDIQNSFALLSTLGVLGILFLSYFYFKKSMLGTKEIAVIATLSAFTALSRLAFAPIPTVKPVKFLVALSGYGFMFDWIMNFWYVLGFVKPITIQSVIMAYLSGLTFDILHGGGSFIFSIIFYDSFIDVLLRYKRRLDITYIKN